MPPIFPLARNPAGPAPARRPGSVRRTSTIETTWPEGFGKPMLMQGRARDLLTPADGGAPTVLAEDRFTILASPMREILSIEVSPDGGDRIAIHEYHVAARAAGDPLALTDLDVTAHVLPFQECPGAVANARRMLKTPLGDLRARVLEALPGVLGCTHLNDVLRSMAETPQLAAHLAVRR